MRIVLWSEGFPPQIGGVERCAALLLPELRKLGFEFLVIAPRAVMTLPYESEWEGIPVYRFDFYEALTKNNPVQWMSIHKRIDQLIAAFEPDLHHVFSTGQNTLFCLRHLKRSPKPLIVTLVNMETKPEVAYTPNSVVAQALTSATWVTCVSQAIVDQTLHYLPEVQSRISVLYSGYPLPPIAPQPLADPPRILFLARLVADKGGEFAIAAFEQIHQRYPQVRLTIAGDGPERETWEQLAKPLGDQVEFIGWTPPHEVYALFNRVTIMLITSKREGLPMTGIEAAFMGRPTIATNIPGMSELVIDGETGLLVETGDIDGMAQAMAYLLDHPDVAANMGQAARKRAIERFTLQRYVDDHVELYERMRVKA